MRDAALADHPRDRRGDRRLQHPVRGQPRRRADGRDRDEPARLAQLGAGLQGDRVPHRQDRRQAGRRATRSTRSPTTSPARRRPASSRPSTTWSPRSPASPSRSSPAPIDELGPQMKSVGEVMAIGRTFKEELQKALRSMEIGRCRARHVGAPGPRRHRRRSDAGGLRARRAPIASGSWPRRCAPGSRWRTRFS